MTQEQVTLIRKSIEDDMSLTKYERAELLHSLDLLVDYNVDLSKDETLSDLLDKLTKFVNDDSMTRADYLFDEYGIDRNATREEIIAKGKEVQKNIYRMIRNSKYVDVVKKYRLMYSATINDFNIMLKQAEKGKNNIEVDEEAKEQANAAIQSFTDSLYNETKTTTENPVEDVKEEVPEVHEMTDEEVMNELQNTSYNNRSAGVAENDYLEPVQYIPGTEIPQPRYRGPYESDKHYADFLAEYYARFDFSKKKEEVVEEVKEEEITNEFYKDKVDFVKEQVQQYFTMLKISLSTLRKKYNQLINKNKESLTNEEKEANQAFINMYDQKNESINDVASRVFNDPKTNANIAISVELNKTGDQLSAKFAPIMTVVDDLNKKRYVNYGLDENGKPQYDEDYTVDLEAIEPIDLDEVMEEFVLGVKDTIGMKVDDRTLYTSNVEVKVDGNTYVVPYQDFGNDVYKIMKLGKDAYKANEEPINDKNIQKIVKQTVVEQSKYAGWDPRLTEEQIMDAYARDIYEPAGPEYQQFLGELGLTPIVSQTPVEEVVEETQAEPAQQEEVIRVLRRELKPETTQTVAETPVEEIKEEVPVEEVKEEVTETPVEEPAIEEVKEETPVEEIKEEIPAEEVKEELKEENEEPIKVVDSKPVDEDKLIVNDEEDPLILQVMDELNRERQSEEPKKENTVKVSDGFRNWDDNPEYDISLLDKKAELEAQEDDGYYEDLESQVSERKTDEELEDVPITSDEELRRTFNQQVEKFKGADEQVIPEIVNVPLIDEQLPEEVVEEKKDKKLYTNVDEEFINLAEKDRLEKEKQLKAAQLTDKENGIIANVPAKIYSWSDYYKDVPTETKEVIEEPIKEEKPVEETKAEKELSLEDRINLAFNKAKARREKAAIIEEPKEAEDLNKEDMDSLVQQISEELDKTADKQISDIKKENAKPAFEDIEPAYEENEEYEEEPVEEERKPVPTDYIPEEVSDDRLVYSDDADNRSFSQEEIEIDRETYKVIKKRPMIPAKVATAVVGGVLAAFGLATVNPIATAAGTALVGGSAVWSGIDLPAAITKLRIKNMAKRHKVNVFFGDDARIELRNYDGTKLSEEQYDKVQKELDKRVNDKEDIEEMDPDITPDSLDLLFADADKIGRIPVSKKDAQAYEDNIIHSSGVETIDTELSEEDGLFADVPEEEPEYENEAAYNIEIKNEEERKFVEYMENNLHYKVGEQILFDSELAEGSVYLSLNETEIELLVKKLNDEEFIQKFGNYTYTEGAGISGNTFNIWVFKKQDLHNELSDALNETKKDLTSLRGRR